MTDVRLEPDRAAPLSPTEAHPSLRRALLAAEDRASWFELQCEAMRRDQDVMQARIRMLENSIAFTLGAALVRARTPAGLFALPRELASLARRALGAPAPGSERPSGATVAAAPAPGCVAATARPAPQRLHELRVAAVLDEFTHAGLAPDCDLHNLPSEGFERVLDDLDPHFLFVESAWRGHEETWAGKLHPPSANLKYLVDCCRRRGIPTVFWNKEDPIHFEHFADAAALFDHVFTSDSDCVQRYRERLGHDRIGQLSFFCQPRLQNPIETVPREAAACFAGSWYRAYPERMRDFEAIVAAIRRLMPVVIYDRNADRGDPAFMYPERFSPLVRGRLAYGEIVKAYKAFRYAIALNTVKDSPTMISRRIYELLASNTITISNPARSIVSQLDGLVVVGDDEASIVDALSSFEGSTDARHRFRLRGLRTVLAGHTAADRLRRIASVVLGGPVAMAEPPIAVLAHARTAAQAQSILSAFRRQAWEHKHLYLVTDLPDVACEADAEHVSVMETEQAGRTPAVDLRDAEWLALFHADDYYGSGYLTDLALARLYARDEPIGKGCHFSGAAQGNVTKSGDAPYRRETPLLARASILPCRTLGETTLLALVLDMESEVEPSRTGLAIDEFGYCRNASPDVAPLVDVAA